MNDLSLNRLIEDVGVSFGLPLLGLLLALANIRFSGRKNSGLKLRLFLVFDIALFAYLICTLTFQDRAILEAIWRGSPLFFSIAYSLSVLCVLSGIVALIYYKLRPEMWRRSNGEPDPETTPKYVSGE